MLLQMIRIRLETGLKAFVLDRYGLWEAPKRAESQVRRRRDGVGLRPLLTYVLAASQYVPNLAPCLPLHPYNAPPLARQSLNAACDHHSISLSRAQQPRPFAFSSVIDLVAFGLGNMYPIAD